VVTAKRYDPTPPKLRRSVAQDATDRRQNRTERSVGVLTGIFAEHLGLDALLDDRIDALLAP